MGGEETEGGLFNVFRVSVKQNENSGDLCNVRLIVDGTLPYTVTDSTGHLKIC